MSVSSPRRHQGWDRVICGAVPGLARDRGCSEAKGGRGDAEGTEFPGNGVKEKCCRGAAGYCGPGSLAWSWGLLLLRRFILVFISLKVLITISCLSLGSPRFLQPRSLANIKGCNMVSGRTSGEIGIFWSCGGISRLRRRESRL